MSLIDQQGNIHRGTGVGGGQFAGHVRTAPTGSLDGGRSPSITDPTPEFFACWDGPADAAREAHARATLTVLAEPGDHALGSAVNVLGAEKVLEIIEAYPADEVDGVRLPALAHGETYPVERYRANLGLVSDAFKAATRAGARVHTAAEGGIPSQFADLGSGAPLALWTRGNHDLLNQLDNAVSVVGARAATSYGEHVAMELSGELAQAGVPIVSGAAYGIDGAAHRAALAAGGTTVAFLAGGVDRPYPAGHDGLIERIARDGVVVSELPCGAAPTKHRFAERNRLIGAAAKVTVVVEAGWRSGSLNTAYKAAALGRKVAAVPGPITSAASAGANQLIADGIASLVTSKRDIDRVIES